METEQKNNTPTKPSSTPIIIAIIIGAWIIGMSIVVAGWLITRELAKDNSLDGTGTTEYSSYADIEVPAGVPVLGDNNAKVTIVEFADFQCPFCGEWQRTVFPLIKSNYIDTGKVRFVYMDFAFLGLESTRAAEAARCAADQNKFWEYHDSLYENQNGENQGAFTDENLKKFAQDLMLNQSDFNSCLESGKHSEALQTDINKASGYGVQSTPTIFVNGNKYEGVLPYAQYEQAIETELAK